MNRKNFLARLIALPIGLIAAVEAAAKRKPSRFVWFVDWKDISIGKPKTPTTGCTLTRMCETPLTPADLEAMIITEEKMRTEYLVGKYMEVSRRA